MGPEPVTDGMRHLSRAIMVLHDQEMLERNYIGGFHTISAYNLGYNHGQSAKTHACPYPFQSGYMAAYFDGVYDGSQAQGDTP